MNWSGKDHSWVVCAYGESAYLEECVQSLAGQTVKSRIRIATSTPNGHISSIAEKYGLEVLVNRGEAGISGDWNFALESGETELVTLAHQDDLYEESYTAEMLERMNRAKEPILYFTNYGELRKGEKVMKNRLLRVKRVMLAPVKMFPGRKWARRMSLGFGNAICCPSITYRKSVMEGERFGNRFKSNLDWEMTERLSRKKGSFVYCPDVQMYHRIHGGSTTSELLEKDLRGEEDLEMMKKFWPEGIARVMCRVYAAGEKSNQLEGKQ